MVVPTFQFLEKFKWGMTPVVFATGISPIVLAFYYTYLKTGRLSELIKSALVSTSIMLIHFIVSFGLLAGILLLSYYFRNWLNLRKITSISAVLTLSLLATSFWSFPSLYYYLLGYGSSNIIILPMFITKTLMGYINYHLYRFSPFISG
jgi:uncharacterized membrane protein